MHLAARNCLAENYPPGAHNENIPLNPGLGRESESPKKGGTPLGGAFSFCSLLLRIYQRIYLFLIDLSVRRFVEILRYPQLIHFLSPIESTRRFVFSGQNDRFFAKFGPFSQENRAIFPDLQAPIFPETTNFQGRCTTLGSTR
jgi:hypothetical protein